MREFPKAGEFPLINRQIRSLLHWVRLNKPPNSRIRMNRLSVGEHGSRLRKRGEARRDKKKQERMHIGVRKPIIYRKITRVISLQLPAFRARLSNSKVHSEKSLDKAKFPALPNCFLPIFLSVSCHCISTVRLIFATMMLQILWVSRSEFHYFPRQKDIFFS